MVFPSRLHSRFFGRVTLFYAVLSNAAARGKRLQAIGVLSIDGERSAGRNPA
jgi:hypothetical protein